jgi:hypothetical protein
MALKEVLVDELRDMYSAETSSWLLSPNWLRARRAAICSYFSAHTSTKQKNRSRV